LSSGSLTIVGTGIQVAGQLTVEARNCIQLSDKLLYLVTEPIAEEYLRTLNSTAESLETFYEEGKDRFLTYMAMVERILEEVRGGKAVCVAFYGHPGVFVLPSHVAIRQARDEGYAARMLPGVSAEDCLFADLGLDPGLPGCQSFEATDFLIRKRRFDTGCSLILWQIGVIGVLTYRNADYAPTNVAVLADYLGQYYSPEHKVIIYEAAIYPIHDAMKEVVSLDTLTSARITPISTLCVPPRQATVSCDTEMLSRLGMDEQAIHSMEVKLYASQRNVVSLDHTPTVPSEV
jgi:precorrin-3B methylase